MSPDTVSSLFPDRPIRPLPKRRLRERLSPEVADSIKYPPSLQASAPLIHYPPYTIRDDRSPPRFPTGLSQRLEPPRTFTPRRGVTGPKPGDETESNSRSTLVTRASPELLNREPLSTSRLEQQTRSVFGPHPPSVASSVDGYESFENTSNKKKRKIPSAADSALNIAHGLVADVDARSLDTPGLSVDDLAEERYYHNTPGYYVSASLGTSNQGISGSGRGRLGRSRNGRSPLRALPDANSTWSNRLSKAGASLWSSDHEGGGIISSAIAKAEKYPSQGQENVSLLQQHSAMTKTTPGTTQFTFTCDSRVPGSLQWPGYAAKHNMGQHLSSTLALHDDEVDHQDTSSKAASRGSGTSRTRGRRQLDRELARAAHERRVAATEKFYNSPPKQEDIWICEFCEYERIFGSPPRALIRAYEKKDRLVRQEAADRKRLLEKAKAKARKGKKANKSANKTGHVSNHVDPASNGHDEPVPPTLEDDGQDEDPEDQDRPPSPRTSGQPSLENRKGSSGTVGRRPSSKPSTGPPI